VDTELERQPGHDGPSVNDSTQLQARALGDPTRYRIFRYLVDVGRPARVDEITELFHFHHTAIRQHLNQLVEAGLVSESTTRGTGRGRPAMRYQAVANAASRWGGAEGPYERLTELLVEVISSGRSPLEVGRASGRARSATTTTTTTSDNGGIDRIVDALEQDGFAPLVQIPATSDAELEVVLRHCPFERAALADPATVCTLHLGIARGLAEGSDTEVVGLRAGNPSEPDCRLLLSPRDSAVDGGETP
jgi:predicted ArsR family transcriptional regulator